MNALTRVITAISATISIVFFAVLFYVASFQMVPVSPPPPQPNIMETSREGRKNPSSTCVELNNEQCLGTALPCSWDGSTGVCKRKRSARLTGVKGAGFKGAGAKGGATKGGAAKGSGAAKGGAAKGAGAKGRGGKGGGRGIKSGGWSGIRADGDGGKADALSATVGCTGLAQHECVGAVLECKWDEGAGACAGAPAKPRRRARTGTKGKGSVGESIGA